MSVHNENVLSSPTNNNNNNNNKCYGRTTQSVDDDNADELQPLNNSSRIGGRHKPPASLPYSTTDRMVSATITSVIMDRYHLTEVLFYAFGMLSQLSTHFFITANDYWNYKFRNVSEPYNRTADANELQTKFFSSFSLILHVVGILAVFIVIGLSKYVREVTRITYSLITLILLFSLTVVFVAVDTDDWQYTFLVITLVLGVVLSFASNTFMITSFTVSSKFPPQYLAVQLSGQSISGIAAALLQIISLASGLDSTGVAMVYFLVGLVCIVLTLGLFLSQWKYSDFFNEHLNKVVEMPTNKIGPMFKSVFQKVKLLLLIMTLSMGPTVAIHPSITSLIKSAGTGNDWSDKFFVPVSTFLLYNIFDLAGREIARFIKWPSNSKIILIITIVRIALVPLILLCNIQTPSRHLPVLFDNDAIYTILMMLFAFSNGYIFNLCILLIPTLTTIEEKPIAGLVIVIVLIISLGTCSFLNLLIVKII